MRAVALTLLNADVVLEPASSALDEVAVDHFEARADRIGAVRLHRRRQQTATLIQDVVGDVVFYI